MLFTQTTLDAIARGAVTVAFRRWKRPTLRAGGTLMTPVGVLAIDAVEVITPAEITAAEARAAGFRNPAEARAQLRGRGPGSCFRIAFHLLGADPRLALRDRDRMPATERKELADQLARWDRASRTGAWTRIYLRLIADHPGLRAAELAGRVHETTSRFKTRVRKLKSLGLTESLAVGYRLSPRGRALLEHLPSL